MNSFCAPSYASVPHDRYSTVDTPETAVSLCQWLHSEKVAGRIASVNQGLRMFGKDRQTVQRFKHVYYMSVCPECRPLRRG